MSFGTFWRCVAIVGFLGTAFSQDAAAGEDRQLRTDIRDFPAHLDTGRGAVRLAADASHHKYCTETLNAEALPLKRYIDAYAVTVERAINDRSAVPANATDDRLGIKLVVIRADRSYAVAVSRLNANVPMDGMRALLACSSVSDGDQSRARALGLYTPPGANMSMSLYYSPLIGLYLA